jgi:hypothetical protein
MPRARRSQQNIGTKNLIPVTNPIERLNGEIKRRTELVGIFANRDAIVRLAGAIRLEQNDEWAVQCARYITLETRVICQACPRWQADAFRPAGKSAVTCRQLCHASGHDRVSPNDRFAFLLSTSSGRQADHR